MRVCWFTYHMSGPDLSTWRQLTFVLVMKKICASYRTIFFRYRNGIALGGANVVPYLCRHIASQGHSELIDNFHRSRKYLTKTASLWLQHPRMLELMYIYESLLIYIPYERSSFFDMVPVDVRFGDEKICASYRTIFFRYRNGIALGGANVVPYLCRHIASQGHSELIW